MNVPEKELVVMVLSGRTEAFEPLVLPYRQSLTALAYRITWDREEAREAVQEALFRAFKYLHRYDPSKSFRNWILRIGANTACDRARKLKRERKSVQEFGPELRSKDNPEAGCRAREFQSDLAACLDILTPKEREVFVLRDLEDMNVRETARRRRGGRAGCHDSCGACLVCFQGSDLSTERYPPGCPQTAGIDPRSPDRRHPAVEPGPGVLKDDPEKEATGPAGREGEVGPFPAPRKPEAVERKSTVAETADRTDPATKREFVSRKHPPETLIIAKDAVPQDPEVRAPDAGPKAATVPQDVLSVTLVSQETGLQVVWFFHKDFDWKGDR